ncbi:E3 ubiquitin-protein ligase RNF165-like [Coccinella septempunctata]|uniref:E3 ubiquitin-protein ligase RNF165-like n=1 Tax=Coccinella septempunctata TaxID=41139 RepID=UPI001D064E1B|nr:E3 ubiquitin-protein ligase RNF165-like [Coccinella septempunctata]
MNTQVILYAISIVGAAALAIYTSYRQYQNTRTPYEFLLIPPTEPPEPRYRSPKTNTTKKERKAFQNRNDDDCTICLGSLGLGILVIMECDHMFHRTCITDWLKEKNECPICRAEVSYH